MKMVSEKVLLDFGTEFDDNNYKSCFARSVAVNSQFKQTQDQCQNNLHQQETVEGAAEYSSKKAECTSASAFQKPEIFSNDVIFERKVCL